MRRNYIFILILAMILPMACQVEKKERNSAELALLFADLYYNLRIRETKAFYPKEMWPRLDHKAYLIQEREREAYEEAGPAQVRLVYWDENNNDLIAYAEVEVRNFIHINYFTEEIYRIPCDTIFLEMEKDYFGWHLVTLPQKYERPLYMDSAEIALYENWIKPYSLPRDYLTPFATKKDNRLRNGKQNRAQTWDVLRGNTLRYVLDKRD